MSEFPETPQTDQLATPVPKDYSGRVAEAYAAAQRLNGEGAELEPREREDIVEELGEEAIEDAIGEIDPSEVAEKNESLSETPRVGDTLWAIFGGKVVRAEVIRLPSEHDTQGLYTVAYEDKEKPVPIAAFKSEVQEHYEQEMKQQVPEEVVVEEKPGGKYAHLLDPNYDGGSVEAARVEEEVDEGELLARKRAQEDQQNWDANIDQFKRRGY